jgi:small subunit ribosomal protein S1
VHISELAGHHVENPREVVSQGDPVNVLVLEVDGERRRLSLSLKRVEEGAVPLPRPDGAPSVHQTPNLQLSEEAFPAGAAVEEAEAGAEAAEPAEPESLEPESLEPESLEPEAQAADDEVEAAAEAASPAADAAPDEPADDTTT